MPCSPFLVCVCVCDVPLCLACDVASQQSVMPSVWSQSAVPCCTSRVAGARRLLRAVSWLLFTVYVQLSERVRPTVQQVGP